jgi:hypothetical protein
VLVDFGLAGLVDTSGNTDKAGYTPLFAAPEQLRRGVADLRSDVRLPLHRNFTRNSL